MDVWHVKRETYVLNASYQNDALKDALVHELCTRVCFSRSVATSAPSEATRTIDLGTHGVLGFQEE